MTDHNGMPPGGTAVPRFEELIAPSHWRTVDFISDLHLQAEDPATCGTLQHYLQHTPADALFILGDLFEVWVGDDALADENSFEHQASAWLRTRVHAQRKPVYFMHGNRDFLVGADWARHTGVHLLCDPTVLVFGDQRYVLTHGDLLCLDDVDYQQFRQEARSSAWQQRFLAQALGTRRAQARGIRNASEARKQSGAVYADVDGPAALAWLTTAGATTMIHGHTHRPAIHALDAGHVRVVLSDWDTHAPAPRAEVLRLSTAGLERICLVPS